MTCGKKWNEGKKGKRKKPMIRWHHRMRSREKAMGYQAWIKFFHTCFAEVGERQAVVLVWHPRSYWWPGSQHECITDL
jgi:hypothetical protein